MRTAVFVLACLGVLLITLRTANAAQPAHLQRPTIVPKPYDGMPLAEIVALPEFVQIDQAPPWFSVPSSARQSADQNALPAYVWVGYIELPNGYIVFDSTGAGVTMTVEWGGCFEYNDVPIWFAGTFGALIERGLFEGYI